jgi:hypothetical protein
MLLFFLERARVFGKYYRFKMVEMQQFFLDFRTMVLLKTYILEFYKKTIVETFFSF